MRLILISVLSGLFFSGALLASACDASSPEEMAQHHGVDAATVKEETTYERKTTSECMWSFQDASGHGITITFRTFAKTDKITNPNFFKNNQKYLVDNGKKMGKNHIQYRYEAIENTEHGVLSSLYGNRFTQSLHYVWIEAEQRRLGVTYSSTMNEAGKLKEPTVEELRRVVRLFTD